MELRYGREIAHAHVDFEHGHVKDSMTVAPQFETGFGLATTPNPKEFLMRIVLTTLLFVCSLCAVSVARADIESGPNIGTAVTTLKVFAASGDHTGKDLDYAVDRGAKPTVYVFIPYDRFDRPLARLLKALEKSVIEAGNEATVVTVFLADDVGAAKDRLPKVQMSLQFTANPLVIFPSMKQGPEGWQINTDAQLTALVVKDSKVAAKFGYRSANETVAPEIVDALKKAIGK
jgi:hypothetical protein